MLPSVPKSFLRYSNSSYASSGDCWADDAFSLASCSIGPFEESTNCGKDKCQFGDVSQVNRKKALQISSVQREGIAKQLNWTKYWEWPPVKLSDLDISSIPSEKSLTEQTKGVCVRLDIDDIPVSPKQCIPVSRTFVGSPRSVVFRQNASNGHWDEFVWLRVQNKGTISRRLSLVPPLNHSFTIVWASTLNEKTIVAPGLHIRILIQFTPQSDEPIRDELLIRVEGDGGIVIPIMVIAQEPPLLQMEDFSCGCCLFGHKIKRTFRISNRGGFGRFWLLSESEFMNEYFGVAPPTTMEAEPEIGESEMDGEQESANEGEMDGEQESANEGEDDSESNVEVTDVNPIENFHNSSLDTSTVTKRNTSEIGQNSTEGILDLQIGDEALGTTDALCEEKSIVGNCDDVDVEGSVLCEEEVIVGNCDAMNDGESIFGENELEEEREPPPPNSPAEPNTFSPGQLLIPPFRIVPSCFSLYGGQEVKLRVSFQPPGPKFFHEKVALLCDNGEVRWFVVKGVGLEPKSQKVITVQGENWRFNEFRTTTLNLGQMTSNEPFTENLTICNSCSLPVYYFWTSCSIPAETALARDVAYLRTDSHIVGEEFLQEESGESPERTIPELPLTILPAQGILKGCSDVSCRLSIVCPDVFGPYGSQLSLRIQQLSQESLRAMSIMSEAELQLEIQHQISKDSPITNAFNIRNYMNLPKFQIPPIPDESTYVFDLLLQSDPLQCWFEPRMVITSGISFTQTKKKLKFFNFTKYEVTLKLSGFQSDVCNVHISPENLKVPPHSVGSLKVTRRFQNPGQFEGILKGVLTLPFKSVDVFVVMRITSEEPIPPCESNEDGIEESESKSPEMKVETEDKEEISKNWTCYQNPRTQEEMGLWNLL